MQKRKEYSRYGAEGKLSDDEVRQVGRRSDVVSYALLAEMSHFQKERVADFTEAMRGFLRSQVSFYRQVGNDWWKVQNEVHRGGVGDWCGMGCPSVS